MISKYIKIIVKFFKLGVNNKIYLFNQIISSLTRMLIYLAIPYLASKIIKYATIQDFKTTFVYIGLIAVVYIVHNLAHKWNYYAYALNTNYTYINLQEKVINKVSTYDDHFTNKISKSELVNTVSEDVSKVCYIADIIIDLTIYVIRVIIVFVILFSVNSFVGILSMLSYIVYLNLVIYNNIFKDKYLDAQRKDQDKIVEVFSQVLDGSKEVKSFDMMPKLNIYFDNIKKNWRRDYFKKREYYDRREAVLPVIMHMCEVLIYVILISQLVKGYITIDILVLVIGYFQNVRSDNIQINKKLNDLGANSVRINRLYSIFNYKSKNIIQFGECDNTNVLGNIDFLNVSFKYDSQEILKNINIHIEDHKITAIVGKSGSGKTTILRMLLRLNKPDFGKIYIDGKDILEYNEEAYSSIVSISTQRPFIFNMSIRDNLSLVDSNHKNQIAACKKVGIHDFISNLPKGYNTILKEDAQDISGGQKQLISLARTILSKSQIILLDEVTSSLDPNTANHISKLLKELKKDHTIVMITHKPQFMKKADNIIVIDKGKVVGEGKHKDLIINNKHYQKLQK